MAQVPEWIDYHIRLRWNIWNPVILISFHLSGSNVHLRLLNSSKDLLLRIRILRLVLYWLMSSNRVSPSPNIVWCNMRMAIAISLSKKTTRNPTGRKERLMICLSFQQVNPLTTIYLDYNASTPIDPRVADVIIEHLIHGKLFSFHLLFSIWLSLYTQGFMEILHHHIFMAMKQRRWFESHVIIFLSVWNAIQMIWYLHLEQQVYKHFLTQFPIRHLCLLPFDLRMSQPGTKGFICVPKAARRSVS